MEQKTIRELTQEEVNALCEWGNILPEENPLLAAGALRNILRAADSYGRILVAKLIKEGYCNIGQDPEEALNELINRCSGACL